MQPKKSMAGMPVNSNSQRLHCAARSPRRPSRTRGRREYAPTGTLPSKMGTAGAASQSHRHQTQSGTPRSPQGLGESENDKGARGVRTAGGRSIRAVRFDFVLALYLVPSRKDLSGIRSDLWWQEEDYVQFRIGALKEKQDAAAAAAAAAFARARRRREESRTILPTVA